MFKEACPDLDEYADTMTSYISWCEDMCTETNIVNLYGKDKPWFTRDIKQKLAKKNAAFISGSREELRRAKCEVQKAVKKATLNTSLNLKTSSLPTKSKLSGKACSRPRSPKSLR